MSSILKEQTRLFHFLGQTSQDIPIEIKDFFKTYSRQKSYYSSRTALKNALLDVGISINAWSELEIENYHHLKKFPGILVSISHTKDLAIAWVASKSLYQSIGIDIEFSNREIKTNTLKFFINSDDKYDDPLKLWVQKEAAFKALSPLKLVDDLTLKKIIIEGQNFSLIDNRTLNGTVKIETIICEDKELWLAKAFLPNKF